MKSGSAYSTRPLCWNALRSVRTSAPADSWSTCRLPMPGNERSTVVPSLAWSAVRSVFGFGFTNIRSARKPADLEFDCAKAMGWTRTATDQPTRAASALVVANRFNRRFFSLINVVRSIQDILVEFIAFLTALCCRTTVNVRPRAHAVQVGETRKWRVGGTGQPRWMNTPVTRGAKALIRLTSRAVDRTHEEMVSVGSGFLSINTLCVIGPRLFSGLIPGGPTAV